MIWSRGVEWGKQDVFPLKWAHIKIFGEKVILIIAGKLFERIQQTAVEFVKYFLNGGLLLFSLKLTNIIDLVG